MFKALFSRKKTVQPTPTRKAEKTSPPTSNRSPLEALLAELKNTEGRKRDVALARLADFIETAPHSSDSLTGQLTAIETTMLSLHANKALISTLDQPTLASIAISGFSSELRMQAAQAVVDAEQLKAIVKAVKGSDKSIYREAKTRLDAQQELEKEQQAIAAKQHAIVNRIETLARVTHDPLLEAQLKGLQDQWSEVSDAATDELKVQFTAAEEIILQHIAATQQQQTIELAQQQAVEHADEARQAILIELQSAFVSCLNGALTADAIHTAQQKLLPWQQVWRESEQGRKASKEEDRQFHQLCTAYELGLTRLQVFLEKGIITDNVEQPIAIDTDAALHDIDDWLHDIELFTDQDMALVNALKQAIEKHQQTLTEHKQKEIEHVRTVRSQIRRCQSAIQEGHLRRASGLHQGLEEKLQGFDLTKHPGVKKQLDEMTAELEKLRDWQAYAVLPKKQALIERMQHLAEQSVAPEDRATAIREMQDEWKLLSRGLQNRQQDLWEQFHELAQKAYEPCKDYFSEQRNLRNINLEKRKEVVSQLRLYAEAIDAQNPNIKDVEQVLQVARNDWRRYSPVDRAASKTVQKHFDELHQRLHTLVKAEQDALKGAKKQIIAQAQSLLQQEDLKTATHAAKNLQQQWKNLGTIARKEEQALWHEFRAVCDQLFAKRDEQSAAFKADLDAHKIAAEAAIAGIEALVHSDHVLAERAQYEQLTAAYQQAGSLPKKAEAAVQQRFRNACHAYEQRCKAAKREQADQHWQALFSWVEQARFGKQDQQALLEQWQQFKAPKVAAGLLQCIDEWQKPASEEYQALMHEKTIDLEILAGVESPASDAEMRMNLQVQRLSQGIGQANADNFEANVVDWLAIGSVEEKVYQAFVARVKAARLAWLK